MQKPMEMTGSLSFVLFRRISEALKTPKCFVATEHVLKYFFFTILLQSGAYVPKFLKLQNLSGVNIPEI